ncbi:DUF1307 domain-containing protein [Enterococcus cecorum]
MNYILLIVGEKSSFTIQEEKWFHYDNFETPTRTVVLQYHGEQVTGYSIELSTMYQRIHLNNKEEAKKNYHGVAQKFKGKQGIKTKEKFEQSVVIEKVIFNFSEMSKESFGTSDDKWILGESPPKNLSLKKAQNTLKNGGFLRKRPITRYIENLQSHSTLEILFFIYNLLAQFLTMANKLLELLFLRKTLHLATSPKDR